MTTQKFHPARRAFLLSAPAAIAVPSLARAQASSDPQFEDAMIAAQYAAASKAAAANAAVVLRDPGTPVLGNPDGDVTLVEFFDYQCTYCKAAEPRLRELMAKDGKIRWVIKEFPILSAASVVASKAALAARMQNKYEVLHHAMMDFRGRLENETVFAIAETVGLDMARLRTDMDAAAIADQLLANLNLARKLKISVVPGLLVNDRVLSGVSAKTETAKIDFAKEIAAARAA